MSRSIKKTPIVKDNCKGMKRFAAKAARHKELSNGASYKKAFNSYNIHDWKTNLYRSYRSNGQPKTRWSSELTEKLLRGYWGK